VHISELHCASRTTAKLVVNHSVVSVTVKTDYYETNLAFNNMLQWLASSDSVSSSQCLSLGALFGLSSGGLQSTWLSLKDTALHFLSPSHIL